MTSGYDGNRHGNIKSPLRHPTSKKSRAEHRRETQKQNYKRRTYNDDDWIRKAKLSKLSEQGQWFPFTDG